jgi:UDP-N-acetylmuramoyl-L-alanyl-D-glutamate--2,6-diaminopimelate ligase
MKELKDLLKHINFEEFIGDPNRKISSVCYDSRKAGKDSCFAAISGGSFDGHDYIAQAIEKGAGTIICERIPDNLANMFATFIIVQNSRKALAELSHAWYGHPAKKIKIAGITGTNGKTTITYLLKSIFESAGKKAGIIGTTGIFDGEEFIEATHTTPESLEIADILDKMTRNGVEFAAMEVSSHALHQGRVHGIDFEAGIFTNLTRDHLDYHATMENYASAKRILFENLSRNSTAVINFDDRYGRLMAEAIEAKVIKCGRGSSNDMIIESEKYYTDRTEFTLKTSGKSLEISTKLIGRFNVENASLAAAAALSLKIPEESVIAGLASTSGAPGRMQRIPLKNGAVGVVDYAHTPDALEKALMACRNILEENQSGRLICIFGCGGDRDPGKRPLMGEIASRISDYSIITNDNPRTENPANIISGILDGFSGEEKTICPERHDAIAAAYELSERGDIILLAGKGHETYQLIGKEKLHFDDAAEMRKFAG